MTKLSLPLTQIIQENLAVLMSFAFSQKQIEKLIDQKFLGEWKRLRGNVLDRSEERAIKACIEFAIFLRFLDDEEKISEYLKENSGKTFGKLVMQNSEEKSYRIVFVSIIIKA